MAGAQQHDRGRHIGVIMNHAESDLEGQKRFSASQEHLQKLGWVKDGIEVRWAAGNAEQMHAYASELVGLPADVIVVNSTPLLTAGRGRR